MGSIVFLSISSYTCFLLLLHFVFVYFITQHVNIIMQIAKLLTNKSIAKLFCVNNVRTNVMFSFVKLYA